MTALSKSDIEHVAKLAKLNLSPKETEKFKEQLSKVIDYISQLEEVDTSNIEPTSQTTGLTNVKRVDEIKKEESITQEEALSGTEKVHNGYFVVPGILEERTDK